MVLYREPWRRSRAKSVGNILLICLFFLAVASLYRWGKPMLHALQRFDARNARRKQEQFAARFDPNAHFRETMRLAEEQVEEITEIADPGAVTRYLFNGEEYDQREDAEAVRAAMVFEKARGFYVELDTIYLGKRDSAR